MNTPKYTKTRFSHIRRYEPTGNLCLWFKHGGKRYQTSLNTGDPVLGQTRRDAEIKKIRAGELATATENITLAELFHRFLADCHERIGAVTKDCITDSTYKHINCGVKKITADKPSWLQRPAGKFTLEEFKAYVAQVGRDTSPTTYNRVTDLLKRAYALGVDKEWLNADPTLKLKRAPQRPPHSDAVLTDAQYAAFVGWLKNRKAPGTEHAIQLAEFLRFTGLRINQAANILKTDVQIFEPAACVNSPIKGQIRLRSEHSKRGKNKTDQLLPITGEALPLIQTMLARGLRFNYGKPLRNDHLLPIGKAYQLFNRGYRALNFPESIVGHHHFRHLAATRWIEAGVNIKVVASLLSHSDGGKLALHTYSHVRTDALQHEIGKISPAAPAPAETFTPAQIAAAVEFLKAQGNKIVPMEAAA